MQPITTKGPGDFVEPTDTAAEDYEAFAEKLDIKAMADEFVITGGKSAIPGLDWLECAIDCDAIEGLALAALPGGDKIEAASKLLECMREYVINELQKERIIKALYAAHLKSMEPDYD